MEEKEICICAAIKDDRGCIWRGHRHHNAIQAVYEAGRTWNVKTGQGFITSKNRFVDREEGYKLQIAAGIESVAIGGYRKNRLFSEDLYSDNP
jgi:hypothetical protein